MIFSTNLGTEIFPFRRDYNPQVLCQIHGAPDRPGAKVDVNGSSNQTDAEETGLLCFVQELQ